LHRDAGWRSGVILVKRWSNAGQTLVNRWSPYRDAGGVGLGVLEHPLELLAAGRTNWSNAGQMLVKNRLQRSVLKHPLELLAAS
jgi:hypothetical protein